MASRVKTETLVLQPITDDKRVAWLCWQARLPSCLPSSRSWMLCPLANVSPIAFLIVFHGFHHRLICPLAI